MAVELVWLVRPWQLEMGFVLELTCSACTQSGSPHPHWWLLLSVNKQNPLTHSMKARISIGEKIIQTQFYLLPLYTYHTVPYCTILYRTVPYHTIQILYSALWF